MERRTSGLGLGDNNITIVVSQDRVEDAASCNPAGEGGSRYGILRLNNILLTFLFRGHDIVLKLFLELQDPNHPYR